MSKETKPTSKIKHILNNDQERHKGTNFYFYSYVALCEDGSLWGLKAGSSHCPNEWSCIHVGYDKPEESERSEMAVMDDLRISKVTTSNSKLNHDE